MAEGFTQARARLTPGRPSTPAWRPSVPVTFCAGALLICCNVAAQPQLAPGAAAASTSARPGRTSDVAPPASFLTQARGCALLVALRADKPRFVLGEPVFATFQVTTACDKTLSVLDGGDYRNKFGRAESYQLAATGAAGERVAVLDAGFQFGGIIGPLALSKGKPFEKRLLIAHWIDFPRPGVYRLTVDKTLHVGEAMTPDEKDKTAIAVSVSTSVEVLPAAAEKIGAVIEALGRQLALDDERASSEAERAMLMIHDERVVPHFATLLAGPNASHRMAALWGLRPFASDEALAAIVKALSVGGLRVAAAQALAENPHPMAWSSLWALRSDADDNIRLTVLHRLAKRDEPDTQARLRDFVRDPSAVIQGEAQRYLRERKPAR